ncbi:MAG: PQQ-binding-like beta-propeller repeat protein [Chloroflexi bacterium]|nr:PQQ-binding-like beta-propeller repeat protein [Chloroflexota bacterium]MBP8057728.1 PQQ-binding-like beta-propeller repeat protein [Chloroflexota bacterium]
MSKSSSLRTLNCPSCHAPLEVDVTQPLVKCDYCGSMVEVPITLRDVPKEKRPSQPRPVHVPTPRPPKPYQPSVQKNSSSSGCSLFLVFFLFLGGVAVAVMYFQGQQGIPNPLTDVLKAFIALGSDGYILAPESGRDTNKADILAVTYGGEKYALTYLDNTSESVRWESEPYDEYPSLLDVMANDQFVYVAQENKLQAFNRADGTVTWQATMSDSLSSPCDQCWQLFPTTLVVLTNDGRLQAFSTTTGELVWETVLEATPRGLYMVGDKVAVLDEVEAVTFVRVFAAATGLPAPDLHPRGHNEPFGEDDPQWPSIYDPVYQSAPGSPLYFFMGFFEPGTAQKWDGATGELLWEVTGPIDEIHPGSDEPPVFANGRIYMGNGHNLSVIDEATTSFQLLTTSADYELRPLTVQNDILLVLAERTRGTRRYELWAMNATSGALLWQHIPTADDFLEQGEYSSVSSNEGSWFLLWPEQSTTETTVLIFRLRSEPDEVILDQLNIADGTILSTSTTTLNEIAGSTIFTDLGEYRGIHWMLIERQIYSIDLANMTVTKMWP